MAIHQIMYALSSILQTKAKFLITTSLVIFVLVGVSNSIPVQQPVAASEQSAEPESPMGYIPAGNNLVDSIRIHCTVKILKY